MNYLNGEIEHILNLDIEEFEDGDRGLLSTVTKNLNNSNYCYDSDGYETPNDVKGDGEIDSDCYSDDEHYTRLIDVADDGYVEADSHPTYDGYVEADFYSETDFLYDPKYTKQNGHFPEDYSFKDEDGVKYKVNRITKLEHLYIPPTVSVHQKNETIQTFTPDDSETIPPHKPRIIFNFFKTFFYGIRYYTTEKSNKSGKVTIYYDDEDITVPRRKCVDDTPIENYYNKINTQ